MMLAVAQVQWAAVARRRSAHEVAEAEWPAVALGWAVAAALGWAMG
jgi:hypothetical protein